METVMARIRRASVFAVPAALALAVAFAPIAGASGSTLISSTPLSYSTTNGDILAITKVAGAATPLIAIGGNFTAVVTRDGVSHPVRHFAVLRQDTGAVVYAGNANSYVRAITSYGGVLYVGGDFTSFAGVSRTHAAALNAAFGVTAWNPAPSARVRALAAAGDGVYLGGDNGSVRKVGVSSGGTIWSRPVAGGSTRVLLVNGGSLYAGGLFETYAGVTRHGLVKASTSTGALDPAFNAALRADSNTGTHGSYDGEEPMSLALTADGARLVAGIGGYQANEVKVLNPATGARYWQKTLIGDGQAVGVVGTTYVVGYHRNSSNGSIPYPYYAAQLEATNGALTDWDPKITGVQGNADGGNNGVQSLYVDPTAKILYLAGAFTRYNGVASYKSLISFRFG